MTAINKTRLGLFAQKKAISVMAIDLDASEFDDEFTAAGSYVVAALPPRSLIIAAQVTVVEASDFASDVSPATLGTTEGGSEILSAIDPTSTGNTGTFAGAFDTGSGVDVYLETTAALTAGKSILIVEYVEYDKNTGEYTKFTNVT